MTTNQPAESEHDFTLLLGGVSEIDADLENALFEAGCDDATLSMRLGRVYLTFSRTAPSLMEAILSAIGDVRKADENITVLRVDFDDSVTQAEIARRIDCSRQFVNQCIQKQRGPGDFPAPAGNVTEGTPFWHWHEVAEWFHRSGLVEQEISREARQLAVINSALEWEHQRRLEPD